MQWCIASVYVYCHSLKPEGEWRMQLIIMKNYKTTMYLVLGDTSFRLSCTITFDPSALLLTTSVRSGKRFTVFVPHFK